MNDVNIFSLWTVSAVVFGFQTAALSWRISREIQMEKDCEVTWITIADIMVFLSVLILIGGVFIAPALTQIDAETAAKLLGLSLAIFASTFVVLAGHYNLLSSVSSGLLEMMPFNSKKSRAAQPKDTTESCKCSQGRPWATTQEKWALTVPALFTCAYGIAWWLL